MKKYLLYNLKQGFLRTVILSFLFFSLVLWAIPETSAPYESPEGILHYAGSDTGLFVLSIFIGIAAFICPTFQLTPFKNKRNVDTLYSMPISREKMAAVHYISGLIEMAVMFTISFVFTYVYLSLSTDWFDLSYMPLYYLSAIAAGIVIYSIVSFLFQKANSDGDGLIICCLWIFAVFVAATATVNTVFELMNKDPNQFENITNHWLYLFSPLNNLTVLFQDAIEINKTNLNVYHQTYVKSWYMFVLWAFAGILAAYGYFKTFVCSRADKAGELTTTWWGYKLLIPLFGYSFLAIIENDYDAIAIIMTYIAMYLGYAIYRRSFKIKKADVICLAAGIIPLVFL